MSIAIHDSKCPLNAVDRRLSDLHRQWHQAEQSYFDPEAFRVAIQTAIQTARTVSFILQSNKALIPGFNPWYEGWQERLKAIPLMRWMVEARNRIEKQGDLESHSWVRAEILASHLDEGPREDVRADLFEDPKQILKRIPKGALKSHILKHGILRLERRWVENTLPDYELLDAVAIAYGHLSQLVVDAHRQSGLPEPTAVTDHGELTYDHDMAGGRLPCMIGHNENKILDIWIATGEPLKFSTESVKFDIEKAEMASERYGIEKTSVVSDGADTREHARRLFDAARQIYLRDGYHVFIIMIFQEGKTIDIRQVEIEEHGQKYAYMRSLANDVLRLGGDAVLTISEIWHAKKTENYAYQRVVDMPDREEALAATMVMREGEPLHLMAKILRSEEGVQLGETVEIEGGFPYVLAPVYAAWGREIPESSQTTGMNRMQLRKPRMSWLRRTLLSTTSLSAVNP
ncbi:hypothetical protein HUE56_21465 [Azospirillum oryzae]|uniref:Uncharacterized protein n=1 Tax=Azospirillum oryzae TaxID=286727 RepID=A0A6N1AQZ3_9PROT|nr:hypothetical protein [Azospirillum oryzae]QKS52917.1 hypothetical protein HUE56_21465 [Azospirillum oryzae]GLR80140.1 hypothetical protein GCM10007856_28170 [Azospirillum oryzae]